MYHVKWFGLLYLGKDASSTQVLFIEWKMSFSKARWKKGESKYEQHTFVWKLLSLDLFLEAAKSGRVFMNSWRAMTSTQT